MNLFPPALLFMVIVLKVISGDTERLACRVLDPLNCVHVEVKGPPELPESL